MLLLVCYCRLTNNAPKSVSDNMSAYHSKIKCDRFAVQPGSTPTMPSQQILNMTSHFIHLVFKSTEIKLTK